MRHLRAAGVALASAGLGLGLAACSQPAPAPSVAVLPRETVTPPSPPPPPPPGTGFAGLYTLEIDAGACTGTFPETGKHRRYTAQIHQTGQTLRVSLSGADIWKGSGEFAGTINASGEVRFTIRPAWWWDYEAFDLVENIGNGVTVIVQGSITASRIANGITGRPDPEPNAGDALGIRLNQTMGGWCTIQRFQMSPR